MKKRVALVDWNWSGHHPTWFNHFIVALEELGMEVLALCPDPEAASRLAEQTRSSLQGGASSSTATRFAKIRIPEPRLQNFRPRRIGLIDQAIRHFKGIENQLQELANHAGRPVDAIFYACIYDRDFEWFHYARPLLDIPWTGLYLHAMYYRMPGCFRPGTRKRPRPDRIFSGRLCKSVGILDEGIVKQVGDHLGRPVVALPDLPDERKPVSEADRLLGDGLKRFAAGRPIVGLFGHLQKSKGLMTFLEAARHHSASGICFALGGEVLWPFDEKEAAWIRDTLAESPNVWAHLERIPTEPALSHLMASCDVLAAAYIDFPHSSGIQAKAAAIRRPLIVSEGYLMAERVRRFRTGEIVPQGSASALLEAVLRITDNPVVWENSRNPLWADYLYEHSFARLKASLEKLLAPF